MGRRRNSSGSRGRRTRTGATYAAPVPATFDVPTLADKVKPEVVNITTTERVGTRPDGIDPFEFFFGGPRGGGPRGGPTGGPAGGPPGGA